MATIGWNRHPEALQVVIEVALIVHLRWRANSKVFSCRLCEVASAGDALGRLAICRHGPHYRASCAGQLPHTLPAAARRTFFRLFNDDRSQSAT
jgi:hypothetical protein